MSAVTHKPPAVVTSCFRPDEGQRLAIAQGAAIHVYVTLDGGLPCIAMAVGDFPVAIDRTDNDASGAD